MHLAAGLQFIGFRGVIGKMWSEGDKDAFSVAIQINGGLFKDGTDRASTSKTAVQLYKAILLLRAEIFLFQAGYHLFTLVYNGEWISSCPTFKNQPTPDLLLEIPLLQISRINFLARITILLRKALIIDNWGYQKNPKQIANGKT